MLNHRETKPGDTAKQMMKKKFWLTSEERQGMWYIVEDELEIIMDDSYCTRSEGNNIHVS